MHGTPVVLLRDKHPVVNSHRVKKKSKPTGGECFPLLNCSNYARFTLQNTLSTYPHHTEMWTGISIGECMVSSGKNISPSLWLMTTSHSQFMDKTMIQYYRSGGMGLVSLSLENRCCWQAWKARPYSKEKERAGGWRCVVSRWWLGGRRNLVSKDDRSPGESLWYLL